MNAKQLLEKAQAAVDEANGNGCAEWAIEEAAWEVVWDLMPEQLFDLLDHHPEFMQMGFTAHTLSGMHDNDEVTAQSIIDGVLCEYLNWYVIWPFETRPFTHLKRSRFDFLK